MNGYLESFPSLFAPGCPYCFHVAANMLALLAYSLLKRQVRKSGLSITARQIIKRLETVTLIETHCRDGSCLRRLTPIEPEVAAILQLVARVSDICSLRVR